MKTVFSISLLVAAGVWSAIVPTNAQPLYMEGGPNGPMIIAVTESNNVYAVNAANGTIIWQRNVGAPVPANDISCSLVGSTDITGTPVVDLASRALFLDAMVTPDGGATIKHYIISLNVDTGDINACWPADVEATACRRSMTIDRTKVPSTQSNFTVLVSVTDHALKTVANGGHVANANGYDIGFYADFRGTTKLKWQVEKYDGTTGNLIAWVKIPSVSSSTDTVFYLMYGDSSINTDQSDPPNTWDSNFNAVWHLGNDTTLSLIDSISGNSLTNTGTVGATTGIIDGAAGTFNGTSQSLNSPPIDLTSTGHVMLTAWVNTAAFANDDGLFFEFSNNFNLNPGGFLVDPNDRPTSAFVVGLLNNGGHNEGYFTRPSTGWHYYAFTFDFTTQAGALATGAYVDAIAQVLTQNKFDTGSPGHAGNYPFYIMSRGATTLFHQGVVDEVRLSSIFRSPEWITTEFNNQSSPGTFISMGSESCPTITPTPTPTATPIVTPTPPTPTPTPPPPTPTPTATTTPPPTATPTTTPTPTPTPLPRIRINVQTNPAGLSFTVDGTVYTAAQRFSWLSGSSHTIATTSPQNGGTGVQYLWQRWSDKGAISHTVAPTTNTNYTGTFRTQYYLTTTAGTGGKVSPASGWKNSGATVSISARPVNGFSFSNWTGSGTGSYSGTNNPASITMGGPITETATFIHN